MRYRRKGWLALLVVGLMTLSVPRAEAFFFGFVLPATSWTIVSDKPIFDPSDGMTLRPGVEDIALVQRRGDTLFMTSMHPPSLRAAKSNPQVNTYLMRFKRGVYSVDPLLSLEVDSAFEALFGGWRSSPFNGDRVSLHPSGHKNVFIAQMYRTSEANPRFRYRYVRVVEGRLAWQKPSAAFDPKKNAEIAELGLIHDAGKTIKVRTEADLRRVLELEDAAQVQPVLSASPPGVRASRLGFDVETDLRAAQRDVASRLCLYFAQSSFAPGHVKAPQFVGVPFNLIRSDLAEPACAAALEAGATEDAVHYAAYRAVYKQAWDTRTTEPLARADALLAPLVSKGLKVAQTAEAQRHFGDFQQEGDVDAARTALEALSEQGNEVADYILGQSLRSGTLPSSDDKDADRYLRRAMSAGVTEAYGELGALYLARGDSTNRARGISILEAGAKREDAQSEALLARQLFDHQFKAMAYVYFDRAAKQGRLDALHYRGFLYMTGQGGGFSPEKAERDLRLAVRLGRQQAEVELGGMMCRDMIQKPGAEARAEGRAMLEAAQERGMSNAAFHLERCVE